MSELSRNEMRVMIFNKEYRVSCPEGQEEKLGAAVEFLNQRMQETKNSNAGTGIDQTIAITALNLTHELLEQRQQQQQQQQRESDEVRERLQAIKKRLDMNTSPRWARSSAQLNQF